MNLHPLNSNALHPAHGPHADHQPSAKRTPARVAAVVRLLLVLLVAIMATGCNRGQAQPAEMATIREPKPTFTPTTNQAAVAVEGAVAAPAALTSAGEGQPAGSSPVEGSAQSSGVARAELTGAKVVINDPLVNLRSGPSIGFDVVVVAERGEEFDITGKSADGEWWQICCTADGTTAWVINQLADTNGPVDQVPVVGEDDVAALDEFSVGRVRGGSNIPLLNARSEPNTDAEVVAIIEAGEVYDIIATNEARDWWQICCIEGREAWLAAEYVDVDGPAGIVPIFGQGPAVVAPAAFTFDLISQEQFAETSSVRIFLFVTDSDDNALAGFSALVTKDGAPQAVDGASFGGQPGFTWPFQDARQRSQNWKAEFPDTPVAGVWTVQLVDGSGVAVGPPATFELAANEPNQELYVRYERK